MFFELERFQRVQEQNLQKLVGWYTMSIGPEWQDAKMPVTHWPVSPRSRSRANNFLEHKQRQRWHTIRACRCEDFPCSQGICERQRFGMSALSGFRVQMCNGNFCPTIYFQVCCLCPMAKARNLPDMAQRKSAFLVKSGPMKAGWEVVM